MRNDVGEGRLIFNQVSFLICFQHLPEIFRAEQLTGQWIVVRRQGQGDGTGRSQSLNWCHQQTTSPHCTSERPPLCARCFRAAPPCTLKKCYITKYAWKMGERNLSDSLWGAGDPEALKLNGSLKVDRTAVREQIGVQVPCLWIRKPILLPILHYTF